MTQSISSLQHPLVKHLVKLREEKSCRYEYKSLVLDGIKPIQEVKRDVQKLLYTPDLALLASTFPGEKWEITEAILHKISGMVSPEGMIAEVKIPPFVSIDHSSQVLALDGISDPGNLGTLLRTALALGWDTVYFLPGCCDPFNEKALRAARGAHFKLSLAKGTTEALHQWVNHYHVQSIVADIQGVEPEKIMPARQRVLVLGNEAHGASEAIRQFCEPVTVPMPGDMESLNVAVAGGILLYTLSVK